MRAATGWVPEPRPSRRGADPRPLTAPAPRGLRRLAQVSSLLDRWGDRRRRWVLTASVAVVLVSILGLTALGLALGTVGVLLGALVCLSLILVFGLACVAIQQRRALRRLRRDLLHTKRQLSTQLAAVEDDLETQRKALRRVAKQGGTTNRRVAVAVAGLEERIQTTSTLMSLLGPQVPLPPVEQSDASPGVQLQLVLALLHGRPRLVLSCGAGTSTLVMALAVRKHRISCRIVCLDHDAERVKTVRGLLARHGVDTHVELRHTPLRRITRGPDLGASWYDTSLADLDAVDLVFVDGPPVSAGPRARHALWCELRRHLAADCTMVIKDANRVDERAPGGTWEDALPGFEIQRPAVVEDDEVLVLARVTDLPESAERALS